MIELSYRSSVLEFGWVERETKVHDVRYVEPGKGKTGKGIVHYWEASKDKSGRYWSRECGQNSAFDIEDLVFIR